MSNIEFILSLQPLFDKWKQTQVFQPTIAKEWLAGFELIRNAWTGRI